VRTTQPTLSDYVAAFADLFRQTQDALEKAAPQIAAAASGLLAAHEALTRWEQNASPLLKASVSAAGLIVPVSQITFAEMMDVLTLYTDKGEQAALARVRTMYDEIFTTEGFLSGLEDTWSAHPRLERRMRILEQALRAHELGMFAVSIPALLAQFEGAVADVVNHTDSMSGGEMKKHVRTIAADGGAVGAMFSTFVCDVFVAQFKHGQTPPLPPFSRHAILHGGDVSYPSETNSRTVILLIDTLRSLTTEDPDGRP
jgi:hypothetical protein